MDREQLIEFLMCNEPSFIYEGREYGICWPGEEVVFWPLDNEDEEILFKSLEELVDNLKINGVPFINIAPEVFKDYVEMV